MRLCCLFAQCVLLLYLGCTGMAMTSPWLVPGGGAVWLRALVLQLYLEHMGWIFVIHVAVCIACVFGLLFFAYVFDSALARIGGLVMCIWPGIMCFLQGMPPILTLYWLASGACFLGKPGSCRISARANRRLQYGLWLACLVPGVIAWIYPWPECALLLPGALVLFFIFRWLAVTQDRREALIPPALASIGLGLTMPPLAFFCSLGCLARYLTASAPCQTEANSDRADDATEQEKLCQDR